MATPRARPQQVACPDTGGDWAEPEVLRTWLDRSADGDVDAFARLHAACWPGLFRVAHAILRDHADAEEAVSDAFTKAWRDAASFDPRRGSVTGWLTMIVRSRSLDVVRARTRRQRAHDASEQLARVDVTWAAYGRSTMQDAQAEADSQDRRALLQRAFTTLPPLQRAALDVVFLQQVPHAAAAARLGVPLGTLKTRVRLAIRQLRGVLTTHSPEPASRS